MTFRFRSAGRDLPGLFGGSERWGEYCLWLRQHAASLLFDLAGGSGSMHVNWISLVTVLVEVAEGDLVGERHAAGHSVMDNGGQSVWFCDAGTHS